MRGLRYRFFDRLLESLRGSRGYRELFHRVFDFLNFYSVRRLLSVNINGVVVPSVLKLDALNLTPSSDSTFSQYAYVWDWEAFGKTLGIDEDKGVGLTAPFYLSSHGYYEASKNKCYFLYFMSKTGEILVDLDVSTDTTEVMLVFAQPGTSQFTTDGSILDLSDDMTRLTAFSTSYISFSNSTVVSPDISKDFYSGAYSLSDETYIDSMVRVISNVCGNTSVARFKEELLQRGMNNSKVIYSFNNGESASSDSHIVENYVDVRGTNHYSTTSKSVITQDGVMLSPGDVWYDNYEMYYQFVLHVGIPPIEQNSGNATLKRHTPWGSVSADTTVRFYLDFYQESAPSTEVVNKVELPYSPFLDYVKDNDFQTLRSTILALPSIAKFQNAPYQFTIDFVEPSGSTSTYFDIVFRSKNYFNVYFDTVMGITYESDVPYISRYSSMYYLGNMSLFWNISDNMIPKLFTFQFEDADGNVFNSSYTPGFVVDNVVNLKNPTISMPFSLTPIYPKNNGNNLDDVGKLALCSQMAVEPNTSTFPTMKVWSPYYVAFVDTIDAPTCLSSSSFLSKIYSFSISGNNLASELPYIQTENDEHLIKFTQGSGYVGDNTYTLKSFTDIFTPVSSSSTNFKTFGDGNIVLFVSDQYQVDPYLSFLKTRQDNDGTLNFQASDGTSTTYNTDYPANYYRNFISGMYQSPVGLLSYGFPAEDGVGTATNPDRTYFKKLDNFPYQFFVDNADLSSIVFPSPMSQGYYLHPAHYEVSFDIRRGDAQELLWLSFPEPAPSYGTEYHSRYPLGNDVVTRLLIGDYDVSCTNLVLVALETDLVNSVTYEYYYLTDNANTPNYSFNPVTATSFTNSHGNTYYYPSDVASDFYRYAFSTDYMDRKMSVKEVCRCLEVTIRLYLRTRKSGYTDTSKLPNIFQFFLHGFKESVTTQSGTVSRYNLSISSFNSTYLDILSSGFELTARPITIAAKLGLNKPLVLGGALYLNTSVIYSIPNGKCDAHLYRLGVFNVTSSTTTNRDTFKFRYASLRFNQTSGDGSGANPYTGFVSGNYDVREFYYPVKISSSSSVGTSYYIMHIKARPACLFNVNAEDAVSLYPYTDSQRATFDGGTYLGRLFTQSDMSFSGSVAARPSSMSVNKLSSFSNGVRPLVFPSVSYTEDSDETFKNRAYSVFSISDTRNLSKDVTTATNTDAKSLIDMIINGFSFNAPDTQTERRKRVYAYNDFNASFFNEHFYPYSVQDIEFIPLSDAGEDGSTATIRFKSIYNNAITSSVFTENILMTDKEMFLNQKVPLSYFFKSAQMYGKSNELITMLTQRIGSLGHNSDYAITMGELTFTEQSQPVILRTDMKLTGTLPIDDANVLDVSTYAVDLIDVSCQRIVMKGTAHTYPMVSVGYSFPDANDSVVKSPQFTINFTETRVATSRPYFVYDYPYSLNNASNSSSINIDGLYFQNFRVFASKIVSNDAYNGYVFDVIAEDKWTLLTTFYRQTDDVDSQSHPLQAVNSLDTIAVPDYAYVPANASENFTFIPSLNGCCSEYSGSSSNTTSWYHFPSIYYFSFQGDSQYTALLIAYLPSLPMYDASSAFNQYDSFGRYFAYPMEQPYTPCKINGTKERSDMVRLLSTFTPSWVGLPTMDEMLKPEASGHVPSDDTNVPTLLAYYYTADLCPASIPSPYALNCNFISPITSAATYDASHFSDFLFKACFHAYPLANGAVTQDKGALLYDSGSFGTSRGTLYSDCDDIEMYRQHYQEWSPYIGVNPQTPEGESSDDTTRFTFYQNFTNSGIVESFNGNEAFLSCYEQGVKVDFPNDFDPARLSIERRHSGYTWEVGKSLDAFVSFNAEQSINGQTIITYPEFVEERYGNAYKEKLTDFYESFTPMRANLVLENEDGTAISSIENGGNALNENLNTLGGGGADV